MSDNYRLKRTNLTAVTSSGNGSARIYATEAEKKAEAALKKAEEALKTAESLTDASKLVSDLDNKLSKEIQRSINADTEHTAQIEQLDNKIINNNFTIEFTDTSEDSLWEESEEN